MANWNPSELCSLFDVDFEGSQLKQVITDLDLVGVDVGICGGAIVRTLLKQDIFKGDIDLFPYTDEAMNVLMRRFSKERSFTESKYASNFEYKSGVRKTKVQIITKSKPTNIITTFKSFDLEHCKIAYCFWTDRLHSTASSPILLAQKKIMLANVDDPTHTMMRVIKYKRLGFDGDKALEQLAAMIRLGKEAALAGIVAPSDSCIGVGIDEATIDLAIAESAS